MMTTCTDQPELHPILDVPIEECNEEHPRREGNLCILQIDHADLLHEDAEGNQWIGKDR